MKPTAPIYLNNAGTSWPKPAPVLEAAAAVFQLSPAEWPALFDAAHQQVAAFFHIDSSRLLLTPSCTAALNLAVMDLGWTKGDRIISSHYEHHALHRTLVKLQDAGISVTTLPRDRRDLIDLESLETELKAGQVRLVALTAACNVTGQLLPVAEAIELAHRYGALALIDGAQIAGWWDLDVSDLGADLFAFAGHKGPQGPWGIGGLFVAPNLSMNCPTATCELAAPSERRAVMPGYCDAGSVNLAALAGLAAGCRWLCEPDRQNRLQHARHLAESFTAAIRSLPGIVLHHDVSKGEKVPTVAVTFKDTPATDVAATLRDNGLIASGGLQCSPEAHRALGTEQTGVIRFSFGPANSNEEVGRAVDILSHVICS